MSLSCFFGTAFLDDSSRSLAYMQAFVANPCGLIRYAFIHMTPAVVTTNLTRRFGEFTAVQDVNLTVAPGQFFGFLGPNGAGKSTTIKDADWPAGPHLREHPDPRA